MLRNQRGLTLIEVLGSIVLLGIAILGITFILQQASIHTKDNEKTDQSVIITRNTLEQIKHELPKSTTSVTIYGQSLNLSGLRSLQPVTVYYPNSSSPAYKVDIISSQAGLGSAQAADKSVNLDNLFRKITVRSTDLASNKTFEVTAFVEFYH
ncbi:type IV pilus modification PilV family protein [Paenibacillus soyae]|uniref:Prepilin-type N-terminal cleavage/methylation domain-containing protein n=1 Tax=Paenibacillus soyae TaxID=2969249 RepID=A0A9X2MU34_9BACL|nr:prepilin-type N-terminal cleavage/methylation domain-containing protein [Paenibacillus soyae]MCR2806515.1 prepilin-type N-terminal cleavage/methylation domain-containing protein [Paenibacillus soyae]